MYRVFQKTTIKNYESIIIKKKQNKNNFNKKNIFNEKIYTKKTRLTFAQLSDQRLNQFRYQKLKIPNFL